MQCLATLVWIFALSTRISLLTHAAPLELHFIPYRWHHPTALVVDRAHDAPSGRQAEARDKDKYGEDYSLEEIEFSHGDIGETGKLDYYIDEGIDYYDTDIFAAAYSREKTKPKLRPKFGSDVDTFNNPRFQDGQAMPVQEGRHFNSYSGNSYYQPYQQNTARPISDLGDKGSVGYSDQNNLDGGRFHAFSGSPGYQNTQHTTIGPFSDPRAASVDHSGQNFQDGRKFDSYSSISEYHTSPQSTVSPISDLRDNGFLDYSTKNQDQDGRKFDSYSSISEYHTSPQSTVSPISDLGDNGFLDYSTKNQDQDGRRFNSHSGNSGYESTITHGSGSNDGSSVGYSGQRVQGGTAGFSSYSGNPGHETSQDGRPTISHVLYSGQNAQDGNSFKPYSGNPGHETSQDGNSFKPHSGNPGHETSQDGNSFKPYSGNPGHETSQDGNSFKPHSGNPGHETSQDGNSFKPHSGNPWYQMLHPHLKEYIVTSRPFTNRGRFVDGMDGQGRDFQANMKQRLEDKDEIMEAVE